MDMTGVRLTELVEAAGCAAKIAPGELAGVLADLPRVPSEKLLVGFDASDDACVWDLGDGRGLISTTDFFPPMVDDPFLFGQVAATNALSDVYAMGGSPALALNLLCFPNCLGIEVAGQILAGGAEVCSRAGCVVAGGHSINDHEPKYGLAVTGFVELGQLLANGGTKALGTGILTTAAKAELLDAAGLRVATDSMTTLNEAPLRLARELGVWPHAATDVTGFSLMGHSCEMAEASGVTLEVDAAAVPVMARAREMATLGLIPAGAYRWPTCSSTRRPPAACFLRSARRTRSGSWTRLSTRACPRPSSAAPSRAARSPWWLGRLGRRELPGRTRAADFSFCSCISRASLATFVAP